MTIETYDPQAVSDPSVSLTSAALKHIRQQLKRSETAIGIRLDVKKSGCSGFKYDIEFINQMTDGDITVKIADDVTLYIATQACAMVQGTEIDYVREGLNSTIKFNNPNAKDLCGCGESFSV